MILLPTPAARHVPHRYHTTDAETTLNTDKVNAPPPLIEDTKDTL